MAVVTVISVDPQLPAAIASGALNFIKFAPIICLRLRDRNDLRSTAVPAHVSRETSQASTFTMRANGLINGAPVVASSLRPRYHLQSAAESTDIAGESSLPSPVTVRAVDFVQVALDILPGYRTCHERVTPTVRADISHQADRATPAASRTVHQVWELEVAARFNQFVDSQGAICGTVLWFGREDRALRSLHETLSYNEMVTVVNRGIDLGALLSLLEPLRNQTYKPVHLGQVGRP